MTAKQIYRKAARHYLGQRYSSRLWPDGRRTIFCCNAIGRAAGAIDYDSLPEVKAFTALFKPEESKSTAWASNPSIPSEEEYNFKVLLLLFAAEAIDEDFIKECSDGR